MHKMRAFFLHILMSDVTTAQSAVSLLCLPLILFSFNEDGIMSDFS
jgi:hypothetical protein